MQPGADADDVASIILRPTDLNGDPINSIEVGDDYLLQVLVEDIRAFASQPGVFAALRRHSLSVDANVGAKQRHQPARLRSHIQH